MHIAHEVIRHLDHLFAEIELAVKAFPAGLWNRQEADTRWGWEFPIVTPRFLVHHTVWCMAYPHLLRIPDDRIRETIRPPYGPEMQFTPQQALDLLDDIRAYARETYAPMNNDAYMSADGKGQTPLGRVMYTLAHTRQHFGQVVQLLRDAGAESPDWYPLGQK